MFLVSPTPSTEIVYELTVAHERALISVHVKPPGYRSRLYPGINLIARLAVITIVNTTQQRW